eukprot:m.129990 g.129990  ORF g.129990 m.129990 type:complete len:307 (-) comp9441_c0_seq5:1071-1991(-)
MFRVTRTLLSRSSRLSLSTRRLSSNSSDPGGIRVATKTLIVGGFIAFGMGAATFQWYTKWSTPHPVVQTVKSGCCPQSTLSISEDEILNIILTHPGSRNEKGRQLQTVEAYVSAVEAGNDRAELILASLWNYLPGLHSEWSPQSRAEFLLTMCEHAEALKQSISNLREASSSLNILLRDPVLRLTTNRSKGERQAMGTAAAPLLSAILIQADLLAAFGKFLSEQDAEADVKPALDNLTKNFKGMKQHHPGNVEGLQLAVKDCTRVLSHPGLSGEFVQVQKTLCDALDLLKVLIDVYRELDTVAAGK